MAARPDEAASPSEPKTQENDPAERSDLSTDPTHAAEVDRLLARLKAWQKDLHDALPLSTDKPQPLEFDFSKVGPEPKPAKK